MRPRSRRSIAIPPDARIPVLDLVNSRIQLQRRDFESAITLSHRVLEGVEPGSDESDYALLNLVTLYFQRPSGSDRGTSRSDCWSQHRATNSV